MDYVEDSSGNQDTTLSGLIKVWCFGGDGGTPIGIDGYSAPTGAAYTIFPGWDNTKLMSDLVFAIVEVQYNASSSLTTLGTFEFQVTNTLSQPGDVLYDYMTSPRYGAGIAPSEIYSQ